MQALSRRRPIANGPALRAGILVAFRVLGLAAGAALFVSWQLTPVPVILKVLPLGVLVLSLVRPSAGLLAMAGLGPVIGGLAVVVASPFGATHAFEQLVLAVVIGAGLRIRRGAVPLQLTEPALLLAAVAVASAIAVQPLMLLYQNPGASTAEHLRILLSGGYFDRGMIGQPLSFAVMTAEALALAVVAERLVREDHALAPQVVRMMVIGHAGLALISIERITGAALQTEHPISSIFRLLREVRVRTYADLNAAGSVLAMVLLAGVGLVADFRSRWLTLTALPVIAVGLWLTGSRTALLALGLGVLGLSILEAVQRRGRGRLLAVGAIVAAIAIGLWVGASYPAPRNVAASTAIGAREFMSRVALEMWRSAPVLGVGIGEFWVESAKFGGPERPYGIVNENAHNNFLQVLAEEGLVGLIALLVVLATLFTVGFRTAQSPFTRFLATGIVVFVLTWLGGHPLLLAEAGFAFWLLAGVLSGLTSPPSVGEWRILLVLAAAAVLITGPVRADRAIREAGFEYIGTGVSGWRPELDGVRYREANATFQLYLPSDGTPVTLPLRRAPSAPDPLLITARVGRQSVAQVRLTGNAGWMFRFNCRRPTADSSWWNSPRPGRIRARPSPLVLVGKSVVRSR